jgi:hypothetical protein
MHISWTTYSCPSCGQDLAIRLTGPTKIGVEDDRCPGCGRLYQTPDKEWIHMTLSERIGHFCAPWTAAAITMAGVIGFTAALLQGKSQFVGTLKGLGLVALFLTPYWAWKSLLVKMSLNRCRSANAPAAETNGKVAL